MTSLMAAGTRLRTWLTGRIGMFWTRSMIASGWSATKSRWPAKVSQATTPSAKTSARRSTVSPRSCSGEQ